jgi:multiple sugar transport system permease protein
MSFFGWVLLVAIAFYALGRSLFVLIDGFQRRDAEQVIAFIVLCVLTSIVAPILPRATEGGIVTGPLHTRYIIVAALAIMALGLWILSFAFRSKLTWQDKKRRKELSRQIKLHLALATGAVVFSVPFYWLITTSLKPDERTNMFPPDLIPVQQRQRMWGGEMRKVYLTEFDGKEVRVIKLNELEGDNWEVRFLDGSRATRILPSAGIRPDLYPVARWSNYSDALEFLPPEYRRGLVPLWNTVKVTALVILGTVLSSSLVAFSFARLRWPGRDLLFVIMLATMMVPAAVTMLPVFLIFRSLGWIDTLRPLWFPAFFGSGFNIFLLRQFFMTIPNDLEDAAKIDGCSFFTIYWKIMLPLIKPALAALTIFAFMGSWNNFMGPLIYISSPEKMTLAYALQLFQGAHGGEPAMMMAAATLVMLPVLAVFFFTQRYMIQGVTLTGLKQ